MVCMMTHAMRVSNTRFHSKTWYAHRIDPGSPGADPRGEAAPSGQVVRILSYNVLGARQGLSKKHGHVGLDVSYLVAAVQLQCCG